MVLNRFTSEGRGEGGQALPARAGEPGVKSGEGGGEARILAFAQWTGDGTQLEKQNLGRGLS